MAVPTFSDVLMFYCLLAMVTGIVLAAAGLAHLTDCRRAAM